MAENTAVAEKKAFTTSLSEWSNTMTGLIINDYKAVGMDMDDYAKECAMEAMTSIFNLVKSDPKINMGNLDTSNLRGIVKRCASLKLNASAYPRECYFQLRNIKVELTRRQARIYGRNRLKWESRVQAMTLCSPTTEKMLNRYIRTG